MRSSCQTPRGAQRVRGVPGCGGGNLRADEPCPKGACRAVAVQAGDAAYGQELPQGVTRPVSGRVKTPTPPMDEGLLHHPRPPCIRVGRGVAGPRCTGRSCSPTKRRQGSRGVFSCAPASDLPRSARLVMPSLPTQADGPRPRSRRPHPWAGLRPGWRPGPGACRGRTPHRRRSSRRSPSYLSGTRSS